jgi:hypothetical protein
VDAWIYMLHPPRETFADDMTEAEKHAAWAHDDYVRGLHAQDRVLLAGPILSVIDAIGRDLLVRHGPMLCASTCGQTAHLCRMWRSGPSHRARRVSRAQ